MEATPTILSVPPHHSICQQPMRWESITLVSYGLEEHNAHRPTDTTFIHQDFGSPSEGNEAKESKTRI